MVGLIDELCIMDGVRSVAGQAATEVDGAGVYQLSTLYISQ